MASNKLSTLGYFAKRMRESGYRIDLVNVRYALTDPRSWTILVDAGRGNVYCTCYMNSPEMGSFYFELSDGGQFIPGKFFKLETNSFETFVSWLVKFGIKNN